MDEDWPVLLSFFPRNWAELAYETQALKGLRKDKAAEDYIRTLLLHVACGHSLRETATRAKLAGLADISDVAVLGRLRKAKDWLHGLCVELFQERGIISGANNAFQVRLFDATNVKEPGKTGSLWRIHYSVKVPSLECDYFRLTATKGEGTGESFFQYSIKRGDYIIADRGYSTAAGIHHVAKSKEAFVIVRVNSKALPMLDLESRTFPLLESIQSIKSAGDLKSWEVLIQGKDNATVGGRVYAIRKTNEAIELAIKKLKREASKHGHKIEPDTFEYAKYVIVFSNWPKERFSDTQILEWYRIRWQVELVFKRFKSIAQLGHLPKQSEDSSKAWLYGKLFVALLTNRLIEYASSISPWGYYLEGTKDPERLARI
jgi:hypothetical protein